MRIDSTTLSMTQIDDQTVVLDSVDSSYLTLNVSGTLLVEALQADVSLDDLVQLLIGRFDVDPDVAECDCLKFLSLLQERGWLLGADDSGVDPTRR